MDSYFFRLQKFWEEDLWDFKFPTNKKNPEYQMFQKLLKMKETKWNDFILSKEEEIHHLFHFFFCLWLQHGKV